jgi:hypothetical protein
VHPVGFTIKIAHPVGFTIKVVHPVGFIIKIVHPVGFTIKIGPITFRCRHSSGTRSGAVS